MASRLLSKYKALPVSVKAAGWFIVCNAIQSGIRFLSMPVFVRLLTPGQFGIYSVFLSWIDIVSIFATLNMHYGVFNNAMVRYPDSRSEYTSAAQSISITSTVICFAVYLAFQGFFDSFFGLPSYYSVMIFVRLLFTESFWVWGSRQRFEYKYRALVIATSVFSVAYAALPIAAGYMVPEERRLSAVIYAGVAVQAVFGLCFTVYNYVKGKRFFKKEYWSFALKFNIPLIPHYLSGIVLSQSDRAMIRNITGAADAGIYSFTYNVSLVMNLIANAVNNAIVPYTYEKLKTGELKGLRSVANSILIAMSALTVMFSLAAPEIIMLFATPDYYEAVYLIPVIALSAYFQFLYCLFGNIEFFFEKNLFITAASVIAAAANVALNALLIPVLGYFAAGYTTLFCYMLFSLAHCFFCRLICRQKLDGAKVYDHKAMLLITLAAAAASFAMLLIYDLWYVRYGLLLVIMMIVFSKRRAISDKLKIISER